MSSLLSKLFRINSSHVSTDGLCQAEREAIIDLLHYAMYVDRKLSAAEDQLVDRFVDSLSWDSGTSVDLYVNHSIRQVSARGSDAMAVDQFAQEIAGRLGAPAARSKALELLNHLIASDGTTDSEMSFVRTLRKALA